MDAEPRRVIRLAIFEAVLWDMDGVLVDSERLVRDIFIEMANERALMEDPAGVYMSSIGLNRTSILSLYRTYMPEPGAAEALFDDIANVYKTRMMTELQLKPGVRESLSLINELKLPQMVVTSTRTESAIQKLSLFSLMEHFDGLIGGDQVAQGKPHPEPYLSACQKLNVSPENTLVIEDSPNGVRAGLAAGCAVVHVPDLIDTDPEWADEIYEALDSLESFPQWFRTQRQGDWV